VWVAFCEPYDEAALWAVVGLRRLGLELEVVLGEELFAGSLSHTAGPSGTSLLAQLPDGRELRSGEIRGVLNRLLEVPPAWLGRFGGADRDYVAEEAHALLVSALRGLDCPVLNPPDPSALCGPIRGDAEWRALAAAAGLDTAPFALSTWAGDPPATEAAATVLVIGRRAVGAPSEELSDGCAALAALAGTPVLGVSLDPGGRVRTASPLPDLRAGGAEGLEALEEALTA
jgi:hypothetical protein